MFYPNRPLRKQYSLYTPISIITKAYGEKYERYDEVKVKEDGIEKELKGIFYYFPQSNTLVEVIEKKLFENEKIVDSDPEIPAELKEKIIWDYVKVIPRHTFTAVFGLFDQVSYYTKYYFYAKVKRNPKIAELELSEEVEITTPCETSKFIFELFEEKKGVVDIRSLVKLLGFDYLETIEEIEESAAEMQLLENIFSKGK